jgi:hypothetical protein
MAQSTFARTEEANVPILNTLMEREHFKKLFYARFIGLSTRDDMTGDLIPSGMPIETLREFAQQGRDELILTMRRNLRAGGVYGDAQLKGNEERHILFYLRTYINQLRNAIKTGGRTSRQRLKPYQLAAKHRPDLEDWLARWLEIDINYAFHAGYSQHILAPATEDGLNITAGQQIIHPNSYVNGTGFVAYDADQATYEAAVAAALAAQTDVAASQFNTALLEKIRVAVAEKNLKPMEGGWYPMVVHTHQAYALRNDADWKQAQREAGPRDDKNNHIFKGSIGHYANFVLYERELVMSAEPINTDANINFGYGVNHGFGANVVTDNARKVATVFGASSMGYGWADGPFIDEEDEDYKNVKGTAVGHIFGMARADYKDQSANPAGPFAESINQSSIDVYTYSAGPA